MAKSNIRLAILIFNYFRNMAFQAISVLSGPYRFIFELILQSLKISISSHQSYIKTTPSVNEWDKTISIKEKYHKNIFLLKIFNIFHG